MFSVKITKMAAKGILKMPEKIQEKMTVLLKDLRNKGPVRSEWPNYGKLNHNIYHCHLAHKWVACWKHEKTTIIIEVYYAGSRENAPY
jgi:mRNA-degrading endonuclease RelE of RelBE toxin-antitoxin system